MECLVCRKVFESVRKDAKYCGENCKKKAQRNVPDNVPVIEIVPDNPKVNVPDNSPVKCPFIGCTNPVATKDSVKEKWDGNKEDYCTKHYDRYTEGYSEICHCGAPRYFGGLCMSHYQQFIKGKCLNGPVKVTTR